MRVPGWRIVAGAGAVAMLGSAPGCRRRRVERPRVQILNPFARLTRARCTRAEPLAVVTIEIRNQAASGEIHASVDRGAVLEMPSHEERLSLEVRQCLEHVSLGFRPFDGFIGAGRSLEVLCQFVPPPDDAVARLDRVVVRLDVTVGPQTVQISTPAFRVEQCEPGVSRPPAVGAKKAP